MRGLARLILRQIRFAVGYSGAGRTIGPINPEDPARRLFDAAWYLSKYPDVAESGAEPFAHFMAFGSVEGRNPNPYFDVNWYLTSYPDVAEAGVNPLQHYVIQGAAEGRNPGPLFRTRWYVKTYPDVAKAGINPLEHFLRYGAAEGRRARPRTPKSAASLCPGALNPDTVDMVLKAISQLKRIEPDLSNINSEQLYSLPVNARRWDTRSAAWRNFIRSLSGIPRRIIFTSSLLDEDKFLCEIVQAAHNVDDVSATLVIDTDSPTVPAPIWLPPNTCWHALSDLGSQLSDLDRAALVSAILQHVRPMKALVLRSRAGWACLSQYARPLSRLTDLFVVVPSEGGDPAPQNELISKHFRDVVPYLSALYFTQHELGLELAELYGLPDLERAKIRALPCLRLERAAQTASGTSPESADSHDRVDFLRSLAAEPGFLGTRQASSGME